MRYGFLLAVLLTLLLTACTGQTAGDLSGMWSGEIASDTEQLPFVMRLAQAGATLSGTLTVQGGQEALSGTVASNLVELRTESGAVSLSGSVVDNTMEGQAVLTFPRGTSGTFDFSATK